MEASFQQVESDSENDDDMPVTFDFTRRSWRDDVTFLIEDNRLYATKAILGIASPVFEAMFGSSFKERDQEEIPLPGKNFEDFNEFLHCIYPKSQREIDEENVYKVLPLADEYDVKSLIKECKQFLSSHIMSESTSTHDVMLCHGIATRHKFKSIREVCARRLSNIGLKEIECMEHISDAETLLQIHKDILRKQGEAFEETRTELVNLYLHKDLTVKDDVAPITPSEARGSIIKFEPMINTLTENKRTLSQSVMLWNLTFHSVLRIISVNNEEFISLYLTATYPEDEENFVCRVKAKFLIKYAGTDESARHICRSIREREFTNDGNSWGFEKIAKLNYLIKKGYVANDTLNIAIYVLANKPFCRN
ncbi:uncharacterized protein LOC128555792 isoform X2 [Mercenaria mercenaria]|uniref:uncharacterized protein LOC128555792 isoform X2 n=1 Tax=Mercenaria mercenaria TaxID=6596 RepID=UPI00234EA6C3|nr:uncharacterized protein LOC128555792 isoform X2 [Mercenaria mercenaria]